MRTVLIIAHECYPYHRPASTVGAQRPYQFAKYLPEFGWRCIVICRDFVQEGRAETNWKKECERSIVNKLNEKESFVIIPLPSLRAHSFFDALWRKCVTYSEKDGLHKLKGSAILKIVSKAATFMKLWTGDHSENWEPVALYSALYIQKSAQIDIILAEHSPAVAMFTAHQIWRKKKIPWILDCRDPVDRDMGKLQRFVFNKLVLPRIRSLSHVISVNSVWSDIESKRFRASSFTIANGFDEEEVSQIPSLRTDPKELMIGFFGNIQPPQDLGMFLEGFKNVSNLIKFVYFGRSASMVKKNLKEKGVKESRFEVSDFVSREKVFEAYGRCDVLLLLSLQISGDKYFNKGLHPAKTFEYIGARRPILVVPGDHGLLDELIMENGFGRVARDAVEVQSALSEALDQKLNGRLIFGFAQDDKKVKSFSRKSQTARLSEILNAVKTSN